jgi:hypothetical protein
MSVLYHDQLMSFCAVIAGACNERQDSCEVCELNYEVLHFLIFF